jgi:hypothetical protein
MAAYTFKDVWKMNIDGRLYDVPLKNVPCLKCMPCEICVVDGTSDEAIYQAYVAFCRANGLYTPWHRARRAIRRWSQRFWGRVEDVIERTLEWSLLR